MEINITRFFRETAPMDYSASIAEIGRDAARDTWNAANENAADYSELLDTSDKVEAFKAHMQAMGFSEADEFANWTHEQLTALFMQLIAGDMREAGLDADARAADWAAYDADESVGHNLFCADDGEIYYYLYLGS